MFRIYQSKTFVTIDGLYKDIGTSSNHTDIWAVQSSTATLTRFDNYSSLKEIGSGNTIARVKTSESSTSDRVFADDICFEMDIKVVDGQYSNSIFDIRKSTDSSKMDMVTASNLDISDREWHHIKIIITETTISLYCDGMEKPSKSHTVGEYRFGLWTGGDITELQFKNFVVYPI